MRPRLLRVAICADFLQEQWPSMDRVASLLYEELRRWSRAGVIASLVFFIRDIEMSLRALAMEMKLPDTIRE